MDKKLVYYDLKEIDKKNIIERLTSVFLNDKRILIALVFGSFLSRDKMRDMDIAIYSNRRLKINDLLELSAKAEELTKIPADISPLTELPPHMRNKVMTKGMRIVVKDKKLFNEILHATFSEYHDLKMLLELRR